jgi:hypothetical protein
LKSIDVRFKGRFKFESPWGIFDLLDSILACMLNFALLPRKSKHINDIMVRNELNLHSLLFFAFGHIFVYPHPF